MHLPLQLRVTEYITALHCAPKQLNGFYFYDNCKQMENRFEHFASCYNQNVCIKFDLKQFNCFTTTVCGALACWITKTR